MNISLKFFIFVCLQISVLAQEKHDVIIIGGGISGLSAFDQLIKNGVKDVILIEASDRFGGRMYTANVSNMNIEIGAQWIHGQVGNPIYNLSKLIDNVADNVKTDFGDTTYISTQDGTSISEDYFDKVTAKLQPAFDAVENVVNQAFGAVVNTEFNKIITKDSTLNTPLVKSIFNAMLYEERYDNGCLDLNELNVDGYNEYVDFKGDKNTNLKYGYKKLIDYFVSRLPSKSLKANEVVLNINWPKTSSLVTIKTSKGIYQAKQVLVTASLGYLKSNYNTLFNPALPANKINSINKIGFGVVDKIFLIYDKPVFANFNQVQGLQILWRDDLKFSLNNTKAKCSLINDMFYKSFQEMEVHPVYKNVLYGFTVGEHAVASELTTDDCLLTLFEEMYNKTFPRLKLPRAKSIIRSKWSSNQFTKGSYSYLKVGATLNDVKILSDPLDNKIFFSGEATTSKYMSTVHGGYITGLDAANKIARLYKV